MPISLLRRPSRPREPDVAPSIGALSLPDLTTPLVDPSAFAMMPRSAAPGGGGESGHSALNGLGYNIPPHGMPQGLPRGVPPHAYAHPGSQRYSTSGASPGTGGIKPGYNPQSPDSLNSPPSFRSPGGKPLQNRSRAPSLVRDSSGNAVTNFHRPFAASHVLPLPSVPAARRGKARRQAALTIMVVGPSGAGKTSLIDALTGVLDPDAPRLQTRAGVTTSVVRYEISCQGDRRSFVVIDTPGLPAPIAGPASRQRALNALIGIVESRLAHQLSEENKVVRRKSDGAELVHLIIYAIDARTALATPPPIEIDWDTIAEPPAKSPRPESHLEPDIEARFPIRRFAVRGNVLPVLTHADALTTNELKAVRHAVVRDLSAVFGRDPLGSTGILGAGPDNEMDEDDAMGDRGSIADNDVDLEVPFAVFAPEPGPGFTRSFRWGRADAGEDEHSDLPALRDVLVSSSEWLRVSAREVVYEKFRTEKLLSARGVRPAI